MKIDVILVPKGAEHWAVCRGLRQAQVENISVLEIGIGSQGLEQFLKEHESVLVQSQRILIIGLAGSLSPSYQVGRGVIINHCLNLRRRPVDLDNQLTAFLQQKLALDLVSALTSDRLINRRDEKLLLTREFATEVVEMEGYDYISRLQKQNKIVGMIRVISDDLGGDIPDLTPAIDLQGNLRPLALVLLFLRQPLAAMRLSRGALRGLAELAQITYRIFRN